MRRQVQPPTPEQIEILSWAASLGAITAEALALRLDIALASARARLSVMQRRGLLSRSAPLADHPALFSVTRGGLRACEARGIQTCEVKPRDAHHLIVCAVLAAGLERCYPDHHLIGERELRRDEREQGRLLASARLEPSRGEESCLHRPDLVLSPSDPDGGLRVAVEVELTIKAPRRLVEICRAWARCGTVAGVIYLAPTKVQGALLRAVAEARASEQVAVVPLSAVPGCGC
jgi:hypothetical protein